MIRLALQHARNCTIARYWVVAAAAIALTAICIAPTSAQDVAAFTMKITEKEMKLEHPTDMMWDKYLMWDLAFQRMNDRNMPYIELTNDSTSTIPLTEFHLTIGDDRFNFSDDAMGKLAMLGSSTPGFEITSQTAGGLGNELVVNIGGNGLQPGDIVRFKIDLDVDPEFADQFFPHPDYRTVLFDMNGFNVYDGLQQQSDADNARMWAVFDPTVGSPLTTEPVPMHDEIVAGAAADFYNNNYRRYRDMDPVRAFQLQGGAAGVIPEPASMVLACFAMFAVVAGRRETRADRHSVRGR